ncbi:hypothetical protein ABVK25_003895 [Lepraria finkii]|uniref:Uncharacterized protein n=1 Tax=Lepraria finkii TaxID=1340010 RepID=A0ABR4BE02_9LECA
MRRTSIHPQAGSIAQTRPEAQMIKKIREGLQDECFLKDSLSTGKSFIVKKVRRQAIPLMRRQPLEALILNEVLGRHKRLINLIDWQLLSADIRGPS